jgi:hypothetical protein
MSDNYTFSEGSMETDFLIPSYLSAVLSITFNPIAQNHDKIHQITPTINGQNRVFPTEYNLNFFYFQQVYFF